MKLFSKKPGLLKSPVFVLKCVYYIIYIELQEIQKCVAINHSFVIETLGRLVCGRPFSFRLLPRSLFLPPFFYEYNANALSKI